METDKNNKKIVITWRTVSVATAIVSIVLSLITFIIGLVNSTPIRDIIAESGLIWFLFFLPSILIGIFYDEKKKNKEKDKE